MEEEDDNFDAIKEELEQSEKLLLDANKEIERLQYSHKPENLIPEEVLKKYAENKNNPNLINIGKNEYKFNSEDLYYKECLSTNHSTCTNEINKVNDNEIRKRISYQKQFMSKNSQNPEMFHFYMVSYLQKGKKLGNNFN